MNETQETTNSKPADWDAASQASAEAQKPDEPKTKLFTDKLPCRLTEKEKNEASKKYAHKRREIDAFKAQTKTLLAGRKAQESKLVEEMTELEEAVLTDTVHREVRCAEYTYFSTNTKKRVRLDTNETIEEKPLSSSERQTELDLGDAELDEDDDDSDEEEEEEEDEQLDLGDLDTAPSDAAEAAETASDDPNDGGEPAVGDETEITHPAGVLEGDVETTSRPKKRAKKKATKKIAKSRRR